MKRVVLVGTAGPRNAGMVLRAVANFGPAELVFVAPARPSLLVHPEFDQMSHGVENVREWVRVVDGLEEALAMLREEGLGHVFARHERHAEATRRAVDGWGLELVGRDPAECSASVTAVLTPEGQDADRFRAVVLDRFDMSLGKGLGKLEGRAFRIGHLGDFNDLMLAGTLAGVEMGLEAAGIPHRPGGTQGAFQFLAREGLTTSGHDG